MSLIIRSLRWRLVAAVVAILGSSLCGFSVLLHVSFGRALWRQFDARLDQDAHAIANMVEERAFGTWEFEAGPLPNFDRPRGADYFEVWMDDGTVLARSASLADSDLTRASAGPGPTWSDASLPNGSVGRILQIELAPRHDEEGPAQPSGRSLTVVVARSVDEIDATLRTLRLWLAVTGLTALVLAVFAGMGAIRSGLRPIGRLSARVDRIHADRLDERLPLADIPEEIQPVVEKLNVLFSRLEQAFLRERQFSADVSHELRTPLAGLRTILEVANLRTRTAGELRVAIDESLAIVGQMSALTDTLLMLSRLESGQVELKVQSLRLAELVDEQLVSFAAEAARRQVTLASEIAPDTVVCCDRDKLAMVMRNLLANAVEYTERQGLIVVRSDPAQKELVEVYDSGPMIAPENLEKIFSRFVRLEASRANGGAHCGIGLALCRALCTCMGLTIAAENQADGGVAFKIRLG